MLLHRFALMVLICLVALLINRPVVAGDKAYCGIKIGGFSNVLTQLMQDLEKTGAFRCTADNGAFESSVLFNTGSWGFEIPKGRKKIKVTIWLRTSGEEATDPIGKNLCTMEAGPNQTVVYRGVGGADVHRCDVVTKKGDDWGW